MSSHAPTKPSDGSPRLWAPNSPFRTPILLWVAEFALFLAAMWLIFRIGYPLLMIPLFIAQACAGSLLVYHRSRSFLRLLRRHEHLLCLRCHYPLSGIGRQGVCPGCREPYEHDSLQRIWKHWENQYDQRRGSRKT